MRRFLSTGAAPFPERVYSNVGMSTKQTIFLSSVSQGLEPYREAVYKAIEGLDDYHCVRMEDFGARDTDPDSFCRSRVADCDIFVGILGQQYGSIHPESGKSYTEREYEAAVDAGKPRLLFLAPKDFPVQAHLIEDDPTRRRQEAFRERAQKDRHVAFFTTEDELGREVLQAIHNCKEGLEKQMSSSPPQEGERTWLLFPWVVYMAAQGFDTGIAIVNASMGPSGATPPYATPQAGPIVLYFYGDAVPFVHSVSPVTPGSHFATYMSAIRRMPERFIGYLIAICGFCPARGIAQLTTRENPKVGSVYVAEVIRAEPSVMVPAKE
jgi:hypothetical protein